MGGKGRTRLVPAKDTASRDPDRSSPPAPRAGSQVLLQSEGCRELSPEQWFLFPPVQPGTEIKFAMFRRKRCSKSIDCRAEPCRKRGPTAWPAISRRGSDAASPV